MKIFSILDIKQNQLEKNRPFYISPLIIFEVKSLNIEGEINAVKYTTPIKKLILFPDSEHSIIL